MFTNTRYVLLDKVSVAVTAYSKYWGFSTNQKCLPPPLDRLSTTSKFEGNFQVLSSYQGGFIKYDLSPRTVVQPSVPLADS